MIEVHADGPIRVLLTIMLAAGVLASAVWRWQTVAASGPASIVVTRDEARQNFPETVVFQMRAQSESPIQTVSLLYGTSGRTCLEGLARQKVDIEPGKQASAAWTWELKRSGALPPGVEVWWQWEITDASGASLTTPRRAMVVTDDRFDWQSLQREGLAVAWSRGGAAFGQNLLAMAQADLDRLAREVGLRPDGQVRVVAYPDSEAVRGALLFPAGWTGAVAFPEHDVILLPAAPGDTTSEIHYYLAHELAHLVVGARTFNCYGVELPTWLSEGLAVYLQGPIASGSRAALLQALAEGRIGVLLSLADGFQQDDELARLSYTYSGLVVTYMTQTYGPQKMPLLLDEVRSGKLTDEALRAVYGLDTDGLDAAWRKSVGLASAPTAVPTAARTAVPTLALWTAVVPTATRPPTSVTPSPPTVTPSPAASATLPVASSPTPPAAPASATPVASERPASAPPPRGQAAGLVVGAAALAIAMAVILVIRRKG